MVPRRADAGSGTARLVLGLAVVGVLAASACGGDAVRPTPSDPSSSMPSSPAPTPTTSAPVPAPEPDQAQQLLDTMTLPQLAGQLLMVGTSSTGSGTGAVVSAVRDVGVGGVFLSGRSAKGVDATAELVQRIRSLGGSVPLLLGTDQEGGQVQVLSGRGFDDMPSAVDQGEMDPATLQTAAARWGSQLAAAGVDVDLGPVLDTVPAGTEGSANPPIAGYDREYGHDPATVSSQGGAFWRGMLSAGVAPTGKHFPGLGRVSANTDSAKNVVDDVTGPDDPYLQPFADAIAAGIPMIMMSSAIYSKIDGSQPGVFSSAVVTDLLRQKLQFGGVVITDSMASAAVNSVPLGDRAVRFIAAGGDMVLDTVPGDAPALAQAVVGAAEADPAFRAQVEASALRVLRLKQRLGLL